MRRVVIVVSAIIAVSGLVLAERESIDLRRWIGKHHEELVEGWGEPQDLEKKRGGEVLVYEVSGGAHIVASWTPCGSNVSYGLREEVQKISFWVGSDGRITKVKPKVLKWERDPAPPEAGQDPKPPEFWINYP